MKELEERKCSESEVNVSSQDLVTVPSCVLENRHITHLYIDYNDLLDLPPEFGANLSNLKLFSAIGNSLKCLPESIGSLKLIQEMYLNENDLQRLPDSFCHLCSLQKLKLTGNQIEVLPEEFGEISALQELNADENSLTKLPKTFGLLENLVHLDLGCNAISVLPAGIGHLKSLEVLNLSSNKIEDLPDSFGDLSSLQTLEISANNIKFLPTHFRSARVLEKLYADSNLLQLLPSWVSDMSNLIELSVKDNQFQHQTLPDSFPSACKKLKVLDIGGNFMEHLPETLGELCNLELLHLGSVIGELERRNFQNGNWLAKVPDSLCQLHSLRELNVDENQLSHLPKDFGDLCSLEILDLGQNLLHELPESFGNLKCLKICMLSKNHLQWLPSNFGDLCSLEDVRLDDNELAELPESFSQLSNLKTLDLFSNRLTEIPSALLHLTKLVRLDIDENDFNVPETEVPQIVMKSKYPPRDPTLRNNWRGRPRQDITNAGEHAIQIETTDEVEFEPPLPALNYNEDVLFRAMRQNLSIWRSHSEVNKTRKSRRKHQRRVALEEADSSSDQEEDEVEAEAAILTEDDEEYEPPLFTTVTPWSGLNVETPKEPSPTPGDSYSTLQNLLEEEEDWDKELDDAASQYDNIEVYTHPVKQYYPPVENGQFTFAPFDIHCADFVKQREVYTTEDGIGTVQPCGCFCKDKKDKVLAPGNIFMWNHMYSSINPFTALPRDYDPICKQFGSRRDAD